VIAPPHEQHIHAWVGATLDIAGLHREGNISPLNRSHQVRKFCLRMGVTGRIMDDGELKPANG
jgi:hypothetical protein